MAGDERARRLRLQHAGARRWLQGFLPQLDEACVGTLSEIFDADEPCTPRGCIAQAWSVAEVLRCWVKTGDDDGRANARHPPTPMLSKAEEGDVHERSAT